MTTIEEQQLARLIAALEHLKEPFDRKQIGKIPASSGRPELDFVGHAIVVQRLNQYAPDWSYTVEETFEANGKFWIRGTMTICNTSRVEYGMGKNPLEAMSHFVRRAAMRFGVATSLWSKEESESWGDAVSAPFPERPEPAVAMGKGTAGSGESSGTSDAEEMPISLGSRASSASVSESVPPLGPISDPTLNRLLEVYGTPGKALAGVRKAGFDIKVLGALTESEGLDLIAAKDAA